MPDRRHDNVPVHVRTVTDPESGDKTLQVVVEVEGVEHAILNMPLENFEQNHAHLQGSQDEGGVA